MVERLSFGASFSFPNEICARGDIRQMRFAAHPLLLLTDHAIFGVLKCDSGETGGNGFR
jgi:hypothetical protein